LPGGREVYRRCRLAKSAKKPKPRVRKPSVPRNPYDLRKMHPREIVNMRLAELGRTRYWLALQAGSSEAVIYRFLGGEAETSANNLAQMFLAVGLEVRLAQTVTPADAVR